MRGLGSVLELFPVAFPRGGYVEELQHELEEFVAEHSLFERISEVKIGAIIERSLTDGI